LAIEGGTNRTSGVSVQGVGAANRDQIEKTFFRAFTVYMSQSAGFVTARLATLQAARDLYGTGSSVDRAVSQAWEAVGVPDPSVINVIRPDPLPANTLAPWTINFGGSSANVGLFQVNLTGFDPGANDLDIYLTTTSCGGASLRQRPTASCVLAKSDSADSWETASVLVRGGQQLLIWIDNFKGSRSPLIITSFVSTYRGSVSSGNPAVSEIRMGQ
jgi:hypothetical protein